MTTIMGGCLESCSFRLCLVASREREYERKHQGKEKEKRKCFHLCVFGCRKDKKRKQILSLVWFSKRMKRKIFVFTFIPMKI